MITQAITGVCINYCTGNSCTDECRLASSNNPFRIDNIVNGTNYTISLSLRNDFGQSAWTNHSWTIWWVWSSFCYGHTHDCVYCVCLWLYLVRLWHIVALITVYVYCLIQSVWHFTLSPIFTHSQTYFLNLIICFCHREQWRTMCNYSYTNYTYNNQWVMSSLILTRNKWKLMLKFEYPTIIIGTSRLRIYMQMWRCD